MDTETAFESDLAYAEVGLADGRTPGGQGMVHLYAEDRRYGGGLENLYLTPVEALELTLTRAALAAMAA